MEISILDNANCLTASPRYPPAADALRLPNLSAGFGAWGGAQPGLSRLDVGPRASLRVGTRMRVHLDYRLNLAGNAKPGSGGVVTLAGDF